jgi:hypothetical protein
LGLAAGKIQSKDLCRKFTLKCSPSDLGFFSGMWVYLIEQVTIQIRNVVRNKEAKLKLQRVLSAAGYMQKDQTRNTRIKRRTVQL